MKTNRRDFLKTLGGIAAFTIVRATCWVMDSSLQVIN